jgi:D-sedoheptulose 7-phosphate isomerase
MDNRLGQIHEYFGELGALHDRVVRECATSLLAAVDLIVGAMRAGGKVLLCGNGGSAADCQHVAAELMSCLTIGFQRPAIPAIALTTDTSLLTAYANDFGFDGVFKRQVEAMGRAGDVLLGISTSGCSRNVLLAVDEARKRRLRTVCLTGMGGELQKVVDCAVVVSAGNTQHVQEAMLPLEHLLCHMVERGLYA